MSIKDSGDEHTSDSAGHRRRRRVVLPRPPVIPVAGYEWVDPDVISRFSDYQSSSSMIEFCKEINLSTPAMEAKFIFFPCSSFDRVCFSAAPDDFPFIFLYKNMFKELNLQLPFTPFQNEILCILNLAPT